ncbi:MAG: hypothetical protein LBL07_03805 [Tannerella sp.]|jgi:hypothetical protein|nr:hypothetical protein [Tannerella sp.]
MKTLEQRKKDLERKANVLSIEAEAIGFESGESRRFRIADLQAYQALRGRLWRLRSQDRAYSTELEGNFVTVTRTV